MFTGVTRPPRVAPWVGTRDADLSRSWTPIGVPEPGKVPHDRRFPVNTTGGAGHNLPNQAPRALAAAVVDVGGL